MIRKMKLYKAVIPVWILANLFGCSEKSEFSERPRGEDPFYVSDLPPGPTDGSVEQLWTIDRFEQSERSNLDVLWVIDNSASMSPYQEELAENIDSFLDAASNWEANIQMAVTSTDMCEAKRPSDIRRVMCPDKPETTPGLRGKIVGGKVIKGLDEAARTDFAKLARLGTSGSSFEHGLSAAKAAVEKSLAGQNGGLVRADSFLSVVIVSDEEDDGVGLSKPDESGRNWWAEGKTRFRFTADDLISYLKSIRPEGRFSVSSVVGMGRGGRLEGPCGTDGALETGSEQIRASQLSGGFMLDVCATDWAYGLEAMANNLSSQLNSFKLSRRPTNSSEIVLLVDGVMQLAGWRYIESRQTIVFDVDYVPAFGAQIEVRYK